MGCPVMEAMAMDKKRKKTKRKQLGDYGHTFFEAVAVNVKHPVEAVILAAMDDLGFVFEDDLNSRVVPQTMPRLHPEGGLLHRARYGGRPC
jgi:hypothetical protein